MGLAGGSQKTCQVQGCCTALTTSYQLRRRLCSEHLQAPAVKRRGCGEQLFRYCFQCGKLEPTCMFDGKKRSCRLRLEKRLKHNRLASQRRSATTFSSSSCSSLETAARSTVKRRAAAAAVSSPGDTTDEEEGECRSSPPQHRRRRVPPWQSGSHTTMQGQPPNSSWGSEQSGVPAAPCAPGQDAAADEGVEDLFAGLDTAELERMYAHELAAAAANCGLDPADGLIDCVADWEQAGRDALPPEDAATSAGQPQQQQQQQPQALLSSALQWAAEPAPAAAACSPASSGSNAPPVVAISTGGNKIVAASPHAAGGSTSATPQLSGSSRGRQLVHLQQQYQALAAALAHTTALGQALSSLEPSSADALAIAQDVLGTTGLSHASAAAAAGIHGAPVQLPAPAPAPAPPASLAAAAWHLPPLPPQQQLRVPCASPLAASAAAHEAGFSSACFNVQPLGGGMQTFEPQCFPGCGACYAAGSTAANVSDGSVAACYTPAVSLGVWPGEQHMAALGSSDVYCQLPGTW